MLTLSITDPCRENWDDMTPVEKGVYCKSCCKNVIDFTGMKDGEIYEYFQKKKDEPVYGRFRTTQLNRPIIEISPVIFAMEIPFWKKFLAALFIFFSAFITGCSTADEMDYIKIEVPTASGSIAGTKHVNPPNVITEIPLRYPDKAYTLVSGFVTVSPTQPWFDLYTYFPHLKK